jgi:predicted small lipoprotein YifL
MNSKAGVAAVMVLMLAGCGPKPVPLPPPSPGHGPAAEKAGKAERAFSDNISANSFFGSNVISVTSNICAGRIKLDRGAALVNDGCFTGDTNVVVCTDASAPNAVMCSARKGALAIAGSGSDEISYARVR